MSVELKIEAAFRFSSTAGERQHTYADFQKIKNRNARFELFIVMKCNSFTSRVCSKNRYLDYLLTDVSCISDRVQSST